MLTPHLDKYMDARDETQKLFVSHHMRVNTTTGFCPDNHGSNRLRMHNHLNSMQARFLQRGNFAVNPRKNSRKPHLLMQKIADNLLIYMVGREGFEPSTIGLKVRDSRPIYLFFIT